MNRISCDRRRYLKEVRRLLPMRGKYQRQIMTPLTESVKSYAVEHEPIRYAELLKRFGTPEEVASSCVENEDAEALVHSLQKYRHVRAIVIAAVICIVLIVSSVSAYVAYKIKLYSGGNIVETIVIDNRPLTEEELDQYAPPNPYPLNSL